MVAQQNDAIHMRSQVTRENKNILWSPRLRHKEAYVKNLELGLSIIRSKIQLRVDRCQEVLKRLDEDSKQMKICFLQVMDMIESSRKLISDEKEENLQILHDLDFYWGWDKTNISSKTQSVAPMIYGIPLKKASISLKRLEPFQEQPIVSAVIADSSPASAVGFARTAPRTPLCQSINPLVVTIATSPSESSSSDDDDDDAPSRNELSKFRRCRKWNDIDNSVSSTTGQEFNLKSASILLKRLDPRSYPPESGSSSSSNRNMSFQRADIENDVFDSLYRAAVELNDETENSTETLSDGNGQSDVPCPRARQDPMVVLERLVPSAWPCGLDSHEHVLDLQIVHGNCKLKNVCETNGKSKNKHKNMKSQSQRPDSTNGPKKRKSENVASNVPGKQKVNCKMNIGRRTAKEDSAEVKRRRLESSRKRKERPVAVTATNKADEDPLEGPSWLYKDGVKKEKLKKFRRIRQGYLTPLYYLAPTIYSSSDDSGDEMTESERKRTKLRKKKQWKRN